MVCDFKNCVDNPNCNNPKHKLCVLCGCVIMHRQSHAIYCKSCHRKAKYLKDRTRLKMKVGL